MNEQEELEKFQKELEDILLQKIISSVGRGVTMEEADQAVAEWIRFLLNKENK